MRRRERPLVVPRARHRLRWEHAAADLRCRDRVRGHVHLPRPATPVPGRGGALPVPPGRVVGALVERVPAQRRPALPRRRQPPRVRHRRVRLAGPARRPRQGGRADPRGPARRRRAAAGRRGHRRRHLPVQEQHRLRGQLLRLPRELPGRAGRGVLPHRRRAAALPRHPPADLRRGQGAADPARRRVLPVPARRAHLGGRLLATTRSRPIINTRDEPHADAERYRRLHVIVGDSNMSEVTTLLKVGSAHAGAGDDRGRASSSGTSPSTTRSGRSARSATTSPGGAPCGSPAAARPARWTSSASTTRAPSSTSPPAAATDPHDDAGARAVGPHAATPSRAQDLSLIDREIDWAIKHRLVERYRATRRPRPGQRPHRPARPGLPRHPPRPRPVRPAAAQGPGRPGHRRRRDRAGQGHPAADHAGQAARRLHRRRAGRGPRLHRRLGAPQAQRPGPAHRAVQGPVPVGRRARRPADRLAVARVGRLTASRRASARGSRPACPAPTASSRSRRCGPGSMPIARSSAAAGTAGSPVSPSTGCSPWSARWWKTRLTTVHGLNVSCSAIPGSLDLRRRPRSSHVVSGVSQGETPARFARPPTATGRRRRTMPDVSSARAERLVNLVLCLLSTRQFLSAERIRAIVPGYADAAERRGVLPDVRARQDRAARAGRAAGDRRGSAFDTADGYRIARQDYELGEIDLEPDEAAAVALAARLWDSPELAGPAHGALVKLRAAGVEVDEDQRPGAAAGARRSSPRSGRCWPRCRPGRRSRSTTAAAARRARSRGARWSRGAWCPGGAAGTWSGHDRDRAAPRSFRVSRIVGAGAGDRPAGRGARCPPDVDLLAMVRGGVEPAAGGRHGPGVGGRGPGVRAAPARPGGAGRAGRGRPGDELELELRSLDTVARWLAGHGAGRRGARPAGARRPRCGRAGTPRRRRGAMPRRRLTAADVSARGGGGRRQPGGADAAVRRGGGVNRRGHRAPAPAAVARALPAGPARHPGRRGGRRLRHRGAAAAPGPGAAVDVRAARLRARAT